MCLGNGSHFPFTGLSINDLGVKRDYPYKYIAPEKILRHTFAHPFKWSHLVTSSKITIKIHESGVKSAKSFICNNIVPTFYFKGPFPIECRK